MKNIEEILRRNGPLPMENIRATLLEAADAAAKKTLPLFRTDLSVDNKHAGGFDPVTEADRGAEAAIREVIEKNFPDHAIIGEEWAAKQTTSPFSWIIDPVDGTRAFISGVPVWGTLIGFAVEGRAIAGLMSQPFTGETYLATPGNGSFRHNGQEKPLKTSGRTELATARISTTTPVLFDTAHKKSVWGALESRALQSRYGYDCYAYCLVASGHMDLVVETGLKIYDIAALIPIIESAGGKVTTWTGEAPDGGGDIIAAATPELLDKALEVIAAADR